jgi:hypothetical protein
MSYFDIKRIAKKTGDGEMRRVLRVCRIGVLFRYDSYAGRPLVSFLAWTP